MGEYLKVLASKFGVDSSTMSKSLFSGGASYGVGNYIASVRTFQWETETHLVTLIWGALTCIVLTLLSSIMSDLYKLTKKKLTRKNKT